MSCVRWRAGGAFSAHYRKPPSAAFFARPASGRTLHRCPPLPPQARSLCTGVSACQLLPGLDRRRARMHSLWLLRASECQLGREFAHLHPLELTWSHPDACAVTCRQPRCRACRITRRATRRPSWQSNSTVGPRACTPDIHRRSTPKHTLLVHRDARQALRQFDRELYCIASHGGARVVHNCSVSPVVSSIGQTRASSVCSRSECTLYTLSWSHRVALQTGWPRARLGTLCSCKALICSYRKAW